MNAFEIDFMDFNTMLYADFLNSTTAVEQWQMGMNQVGPPLSRVAFARG
jgi:hypothetical protein